MADDLKALSAMAVEVAEIYAARFKAPRDAGFILMKLSEEMGELTGAWLQAQGRGRGSASAQDVADEVADVLGFLLVLAHKEGIDPSAALHRKWGQYLPQPPAAEAAPRDAPEDWQGDRQGNWQGDQT